MPSADEQPVGQCVSLGKLLGFLDHGNAHVTYGLLQYTKLLPKIEGMAKGAERDDLEGRARLMGAALLLHVYGHAHEQQCMGWRDNLLCKRLVKELEDTVLHQDLLEAHDLLCSDTQLECGVYCADRAMLGLKVHYAAGEKQQSKVTILPKGDEVRQPFSPAALVRAGGALLREGMPWFRENFTEDEEDENDGLPKLGLQVNNGATRAWRDCLLPAEKDARGAEAPSLCAELHSLVNAEILASSALQIKLVPMETSTAYKKRKRGSTSGTENQEGNAMAKRTAPVKTSAKLVAGVASSGQCVEDIAFDTIFQEYGQETDDHDKPKYCAADKASIKQKYNSIHVRIQLKEFQDAHKDIDWSQVRENRVAMLGAAKAWHDAYKNGDTVCAFCETHMHVTPHSPACSAMFLLPWTPLLLVACAPA